MTFKPGDRVRFLKRRWHGVVTSVEAERGIVWCQFEGIGRFGADPSNLELAPTIGADHAAL